MSRSSGPEGQILYSTFQLCSSYSVPPSASSASSTGHTHTSSRSKNLCSLKSRDIYLIHPCSERSRYRNTTTSLYPWHRHSSFSAAPPPLSRPSRSSTSVLSSHPLHHSFTTTALRRLARSEPSQNFVVTAALYIQTFQLCWSLKLCSSYSIPTLKFNKDSTAITVIHRQRSLARTSFEHITSSYYNDWT
ncbi:hypothetical protein BDQ17DRAFT_1035067 [Cyathus striatus]|nr:hypothetical protein BDQ17DRAFT_1035067 [Cyathus striatus]